MLAARLRLHPSTGSALRQAQGEVSLGVGFPSPDCGRGGRGEGADVAA